ncbi:MAG: aminotransferase class I/II-fold pyridoxal phosphate-dependent enzyme [Chloroflexi bacterium]|nr:aminotransferase class I/II-fold pyridoxal phosphate-dependent enzyme [Chloroflexota bacterium]
MGSSYLSQRVAGLKPSGIRKFFDIVSTMHDVISLGIGEPDFTTPPPILQAGIHSLQSGETHYTSNAGILELRQEIAKHLYNLYGVSYNPENEVVVTVGGSEALYLSLTALLDPGDEVIVITPCFVAYQAGVQLAGGVAVEVPCRLENNFDIDPDDVRAAVTPRTRAILLSFPNNPTGAVASRERLMEVARIAEEYDLIVISDEIYARLVYGNDHVCFAALPGMRERTILVNGFSKAYAMTGWRIGYAAAPEGIMSGMARVHQYSLMCSSTTAQKAAYHALTVGEPYVQQMVAEYDRRRRLIVDGLNAIGLQTFEPCGAFYAFPYIGSTGLDDETFANRLLMEERVAVVPGSAFGKGGEGFVRCSYATAYEKIEEALERMGRFVNRLR